MSAHGRSASASQASVPSAGDSTTPKHETTAALGHAPKDSDVVQNYRKHRRAKSSFHGGIAPNSELAKFLRSLSEPPTLLGDSEDAPRKRPKLSEIFEDKDPLKEEAPQVDDKKKASLASLAGSVIDIQSRRPPKEDTENWQLNDFMVDTAHLLDSAGNLFDIARQHIVTQLGWPVYSKPLDAIKSMRNAYPLMFTSKIKMAFQWDNDRWAPVSGTI
ncbi:hypothetical protein B0T20DRAFT_390982 [Sordaria brevicollis]|uniref:Uncharacterized protein n=1 Tax=Sordaria brevicollis TaxID=83679 RepID=A0AAE0UES7_SORBR|nr:hypothetical protein B0T20DRAFT_390982 [Sordaria brevicollis]